MKWEVEFEEHEIRFSLETESEETLKRWREKPSYCYETIIEKDC